MAIHAGLARIRRDRDGTISITPSNTSSPSDAFTALLPVAGGLVSIDVHAPAMVPAALLAEASAAAWWLPLVFGDEVATAVARMAAGSDLPEEEEITVQAWPAVLTGASVKLALGLWLHRWWPAPDGRAIPLLDEQLLELEIGALAWHCEPLLTDTSLADTMLSKHAPDLLSRITAGQSTTAGRVSELIERMLLDALEATVDTAPLDNNLRQTLEEALHRVQAQSKIIGASQLSLDKELRSLLGEFAGEHRSLKPPPSPTGYGVPALALHAGHQPAGTQFSTGRDSVDWMQVPPRVLGSNENGIRWEVRRDMNDTWEIVVTATAAPVVVSADDHVLFARIYGHDEPLPLAIIQLARKGANYAGSAHISPQPDTNQNPGKNMLEVDVYTERYVSSPRRGRRKAEGVRERSEVKELITQRVHAAKSETSLDAHEKGSAIILVAELAAAATM